MARKAIRIRGARTHNLRDLDLDLPRDAWTVVCGVSGSGKSSLVLDTLGAESRRRFLGTLSRGRERGTGGPGEGLERPDVDRIEGLPPAVAAGFTARLPGPRQTLGTITEATHALRALFARVATPHCPECGGPTAASTREQVVARLLDLPEGTRVLLLAPRGDGPAALEDARRDGFVRVRVGSGEVRRTEDLEPGAAKAGERVEVVVDRLVVKDGAADRIAGSVEQALSIGSGVLRARLEGGEGVAREHAWSDRPRCARCDRLWPRLSTALFSFHTPLGACPECEGRGEVLRLDPERVLPRRLRLDRLGALLRPHLRKEDLPHLKRCLAPHAARRPATRPATGGGEGRRVGDLPDRARARLLRGGKGRDEPGLLGLLERGRRTEALSLPHPCPACAGARLAPYPRAATVEGESLPALESRPVADLRGWIERLRLPGDDGALAAPAIEDLLARLRFLGEVGLDYLSLGRAAATLSGGELRRARLAAACAARMSGLLFLLDEPSAGLHPVDRAGLRRRLRGLVEEGNTLVCVEHDPSVLLEADHVLELGPGAGAAGGAVVAEGSARAVLRAGKAPIVRALAEAPPAPQPAPRRAGRRVAVRGARAQNLRGIDVEVPFPGFTCLTGVSGAGKSTLLLDVIAPAAHALLDGSPFPADRLDAMEGPFGADGIARVSVASGAPPRHPRATPGSVLGVLPALRGLYAATLEARSRGWGPARFSAHVRGGRCEACQGTGERRVAMRDLPPVRLPCEACGGKAFHRSTLEVRVKGMSIADLHALPLARAAEAFRDVAPVARALEAAVDVGLGYLPLGEPTSRLSGGEALRLKLAAALGRGGRTATLYLLDEPSAGLHPADVAHLAEVLLRLAEAGSAVVAVEHHLRLVRLADRVVELGPGPGPDGGRVVFAGAPADLLAEGGSPTARALREEDARAAAHRR